MSNLDKEIRTKLYNEINSETGMEDMERMVRGDPMMYFKCIDLCKTKTQCLVKLYDSVIANLVYADGLTVRQFIQTLTNERVADPAFLMKLAMLKNMAAYLPIRCMTKPLALKALEHDANTYGHLDRILQDDPEIAYSAVLADPKNIQYVPQQTPDLCMLALIKDHTCYNMVRAPTIFMQMFVKQRIDVIDDLKCMVLLEF